MDATEKLSVAGQARRRAWMWAVCDLGPGPAGAHPPHRPAGVAAPPGPQAPCWCLHCLLWASPPDTGRQNVPESERHVCSCAQCRYTRSFSLPRSGWTGVTPSRGWGRGRSAVTSSCLSLLHGRRVWGSGHSC